MIMTTENTEAKTLKDLLLFLSNLRGAEFYFYNESKDQKHCFLEYDGLRYYEGSSGDFYAMYDTIDGSKKVKIDNWCELIQFIAEY